jgi:hypothetical protein
VGKVFAIWIFFLALVAWSLLSTPCNHQDKKLFWLIAWRMRGSAKERAARS